MDGVLVIDKPAGPTSHDVVARVRRALKMRRVGHTGTLDPAATGVLPLVLGRATRLAQFLTSADKAYRARIRLGVVTDTYDATGRVIATRPIDPAALGPDRIDAALTALRGAQMQTPPPFSAKKIRGVRAYKLARRQVAVEPVPVPVVVYRLEAVASGPDWLEVEVICSAGFYVRALAHDLGLRLGCGGILDGLQRTRSGDFDLQSAVPLEQVERAGRAAARHLVPLSRLLPCFPGVVLTPRGARRAAHGHAISPVDLASPIASLPEAGEPGERDLKVRLFDDAGALVAIAEPKGGGVLRPLIVLG